MKKTLLISMMLVLAALMLFVSCKKDPEVTNADRFLESYNAADFVLNAYVGGVYGYSEGTSVGGSFYNLNYCYSGNNDPIMSMEGGKYLNLFTNKAKTKRVGISEFTNYSTTQAVNGNVYDKLGEVGADNVNLAFKYKDQTSSDNGANWTNSSDEKTGFFLCNAKRTKEQVGDTTSTIYKYTITDIKLSVKKVNGEWLDVSSKTEIEYKSITYEMDGTDLSTLSNLTYDGTALTATEVKAVIDALNK